MSNSIFPTLAGNTFPEIRTPEHSNITLTSDSGREVRIARWSYPKWHWEIPYSYLSADAAVAHFQTLAGFFNQMHGDWDTFLYKDRYDNGVVTNLFGTGDGVTTKFQLQRTFGGFTEPIYDVNSSIAAPLVYKNGVLLATPTDYAIDSQGMVTFVTAPAAVPLTVTFNYYFRVRFKESSLDFEEFIYNYFECKKVELIQANL